MTALLPKKNNNNNNNKLSFKIYYENIISYYFLNSITQNIYDKILLMCTLRKHNN